MQTNDTKAFTYVMREEKIIPVTKAYRAVKRLPIGSTEIKKVRVGSRFSGRSNSEVI